GRQRGPLPRRLDLEARRRGQVTPKEEGVQWELGAVGTAEWTGVPLAAVLERAGVRQHAVEVILQGADAGEVKEEPQTPGKIPFARSLRDTAWRTPPRPA